MSATEQSEWQIHFPKYGMRAVQRVDIATANASAAAVLVATFNEMRGYGDCRDLCSLLAALEQTAEAYVELLHVIAENPDIQEKVDLLMEAYNG